MIQIEYTDTFGGEANYCWVKRWFINMELTNRTIIKLAKKLCNLTGIKCRITDMGDCIEIRPIGVCQVIFVYYTEVGAGEEIKEIS